MKGEKVQKQTLDCLNSLSVMLDSKVIMYRLLNNFKNTLTVTLRAFAPLLDI